MTRFPPVPGIRYLYCIPPHTHALMRYRVHSVTPAHVAIYEASGVTVDSETTEEIGTAPGGAEGGAIRIVPRDRIDVVRTWEGAPPDRTVYYSTIDSYRRLHEMALARYGRHVMRVWADDAAGTPEDGADAGDWAAGWAIGWAGEVRADRAEGQGGVPSDAGPQPAAQGVSEAELDRLRKAMMEAHPDHGGTSEAFERAYEAYEAARRLRAGPD